MEDLIFKIVSITLLLFFIYVIFIRPNIIFSRTISEEFKNRLLTDFNLSKTDDLRFSKKINPNANLEILIIKPTRQLFDKITMRIMVLDESIKQSNHSKYHIVDGLISRDLFFMKKSPSKSTLQAEIDSIEKEYMNVKNTDANNL